MKQNALFVRHKAKPGKRDALFQVWEKYVRPYVEASPGQLVYVYGFDDSDPDAIIAYQLFTDGAGNEGFVEQPWYKDYQSETAELLVGPSEFHLISPQWIKLQD